MSAALIAPVSKWYRKPTPWWIDGFEETDEVVEEEENVIEEDEDDLDENEQTEDVALADAWTAGDYMQLDVAFENQGDEEDTILEVLPGIDRDQKEDAILVDDGNFDIDNRVYKSEGNDTLVDDIFTGEELCTKKLHILGSMIILEVETIDDYEWDEEAMLNVIVVEVDPENDRDEGTTNWSTTPPTPVAPQIRSRPGTPGAEGPGPGKPGSETRWVTTRTACQWWAGSRDGSGYDPGKAYLKLSDGLAVKVAGGVGYPLATVVVEHDIGYGSARALSVGGTKDFCVQQWLTCLLGTGDWRSAAIKGANPDQVRRYSLLGVAETNVLALRFGEVRCKYDNEETIPSLPPGNFGTQKKTEKHAGALIFISLSGTSEAILKIPTSSPKSKKKKLKLVNKKKGPGLVLHRQLGTERSHSKSGGGFTQALVDDGSATRTPATVPGHISRRGDSNCSDTHPGQLRCPSGDDGNSSNGGPGQTCCSRFLDPRFLFFLFIFPSVSSFDTFYDTHLSVDQSTLKIEVVASITIHLAEDKDARIGAATKIDTGSEMIDHLGSGLTGVAEARRESEHYS
ncbi:hypothetical protein F5887DRAFT_915709 [Amanita rubescens]|nr:hypothetical protein F5887DRAFT_915709 [Amanita rubescens]